jgi:hypothetical protein
MPGRAPHSAAGPPPPFDSSCIEGDAPIPIPDGLKFGTFEVKPNSAAYKFIVSRVAESLPDATVDRVQRIWNQQAWGPFQLARGDVARENGGDANTKLAFHGADSDTLRKIVGLTLDAGSTKSMFNSNFSGDCAYSLPGCGIYFAEHAIYPVRIHPRHYDDVGGTYTLVAAEVICGNQKDFGSGGRQLNTPPGSHHSVTGTEDGIGIRHIPHGVEEFGKQHVIYQNAYAYPLFVITLRPPRPPSALPEYPKRIEAIALQCGVPLVLKSLSTTMNLQNRNSEAVVPKAANPAANPAANLALEQLMIVRAPEDPRYFGIMSLGQAPYKFLRVHDDNTCKFDQDHCKVHEQWSVEFQGYNLILVSRRNSKVLHCTKDNELAKTEDKDDTIGGKWKLSPPDWPYPFPLLAPPLFHMVLGRAIFLKSCRFEKNLQNCATSEFPHAVAKAADSTMGSHEKLMIVRAPDDPNYFGIMSLKGAPHKFLRVDDDNTCKFDQDRCQRHGQWSVEADPTQDGVVFFVSHKNEHVLQCTDGNVSVVAADGTHQERAKWSIHFA